MRNGRENALICRAIAAEKPDVIPLMRRRVCSSPSGKISLSRGAIRETRPSVRDKLTSRINHVRVAIRPYYIFILFYYENMSAPHNNEWTDFSSATRDNCF